MSKLLTVFGTIVVAFFLFTSVGKVHSKFSTGDTGVAAQDIVVVTDYNSASQPECTIHKGSSVRFTGFSSLSRGGGSEGQPIIQITSVGCTGWAWDVPSLNKKIK